MIYSNLNNFLVISPPKTGSTSVSAYFADSGVLTDDDVMVWSFPPLNTGFIETMNPGDTNFPTRAFIKDENNVFVRDPNYKPENPNYLGGLSNTHMTHAECMEKNIGDETTPSYATIRHPVPRFLSGISGYVNNSENYENPSISYEDKVLLFIEKFMPPTSSSFMFIQPQKNWFGPNTVLWPTEYLHQAISSFLESKNGSVRGEWSLRDRGDNTTKQWDNNISESTKNTILGFYQEDLALWNTAVGPYSI